MKLLENGKGELIGQLIMKRRVGGPVFCTPTACIMYSLTDGCFGFAISANKRKVMSSTWKLHRD